MGDTLDCISIHAVRVCGGGNLREITINNNLSCRVKEQKYLVTANTGSKGVTEAGVKPLGKVGGADFKEQMAVEN